MKLGIIMDPIEAIRIHKDSSFAMLLASQSLGWQNFYILPDDVYLEDGEAWARTCKIEVSDNPSGWYHKAESMHIPLAELDIILMRKDPPVDMHYIYITQILEFAERAGVAVINHPTALRDFNEKLSILHFPDYIAPTLVSAIPEQLHEFILEHEDTILKPLDGMGGASIFRIRRGDTNSNVIIETVSQHGRKPVMIQRFIPDISEGDKRILLIDGEPIPYALARIPLAGENRGNIAAGGVTKGLELCHRDREICGVIAPFLRENGLFFTGIDVIGDYLTEINITSPTCIRELDKIFSLNIANDLLLAIEQRKRPNR